MIGKQTQPNYCSRHAQIQANSLTAGGAASINNKHTYTVRLFCVSSKVLKDLFSIFLLISSYEMSLKLVGT